MNSIFRPIGLTHTQMQVLKNFKESNSQLFDAYTTYLHYAVNHLRASGETIQAAMTGELDQIADHSFGQNIQGFISAWQDITQAIDTGMKYDEDTRHKIKEFLTQETLCSVELLIKKRDAGSGSNRLRSFENGVPYHGAVAGK